MKPRRPTAAPLVPPRPTLRSLVEAAKKCRACPLFANATQTVFGAGPRRATVIFVGEQPGNAEDIAGEPFVGPAGRMLDKALVEAGIDRSTVYVTNVVKHFKNEPRGKLRIHKKPNQAEIEACRPWLDAEIAVLKPEVIVCLGATAAQALLGRSFRVTQQRGEMIRTTETGPAMLATVHPSSILRAPDSATRHAETEAFIRDLRVVARHLANRRG